MKVGICFSGGGMKGVAHVGVLKALEEENIKFDYISGTSSGSIVAALYSIGYNSDEIIYNNDINIGKAVRASCSYPGIFEPMFFENNYLIDGGIRENVPWKILKENGADKVISIIFQNDIEEKSEINIFYAISSSIDILCHELVNYELEGADYLLKIRTKDIDLLDKSKIKYLYQLGYIEAKGKINEIIKLINN